MTIQFYYLSIYDYTILLSIYLWLYNFTIYLSIYLWLYNFNIYLSIYIVLPKVLGRPLLMNRFDYFSNFYEYKS